MKNWKHNLKNFYSKTIRILKGTIEDFSKNNDSLKASALTYYTLISMVPFLAVALGIASGFGFAQYLERQLLESFSDQKQVVEYAIWFAETLLKNVQSSVVAGIGVIALLWTNISLLNSIENALNDIWKVRQPRTWGKKLTDYLAVMIICPIFFVVSSSLSVFLITQITKTSQESEIIGVVGPYLLLILQLVPVLLSILLFVVIYLFIPNAKVQTRPRIIAGILAGILFQFWQWFYIRFQVEITNYSAVYGTFAALPLFLFWLQVSWLILLAGAELAAHIENEMSYKSDTAAREKVKVTEIHLGIFVLYRCIQAYTKGEHSPTAIEIAKDLGLPLLVTQKMLDLLTDTKVLVEIGAAERSQCGYQPSKDASLFTLQGVTDAIIAHEAWPVEVDDSPEIQNIIHRLKALHKAAEQSPANINFRSLEDKLG